MVADEPVGDAAQVLARGLLVHRPQAPGAQPGRVATGEQGEDDLGVRGVVEVRLRLLGPKGPLLDAGDRVAFALGAGVGLRRVDLDEAVSPQAGQRRVDLRVRDWMAAS